MRPVQEVATARKPDALVRARIVAAGAAILWLVTAAFWATLVGPLALVALAPPLLLAWRGPGVAALLATWLLSLIAAAIGLLAYLTSTRDPTDYSLALLAVTPALAALYSALALRRVPREVSSR
jgi:thiamine transporter ThiT